MTHAIQKCGAGDRLPAEGAISGKPGHVATWLVRTVDRSRSLISAACAALAVLGIAQPAAAATFPRDVDPAVDPSFDVTNYGDRGGPTDLQVAMVVITLGVILFALLIIGAWLAVRWYRRRNPRTSSIDEADVRGSFGAPGDVDVPMNTDLTSHQPADTRGGSTV